MINFNKYSAKVETQSVDFLKKRNLSNRLKFDYNREDIVFNNNEYRVVIQSDGYYNTEKYFKISAPKEIGLKTGNVFYWKRQESYFMIVLQRKTEKTYFTGRIQEARYPVSYLDSFNNKVTQYGVIKNIEDTTRSNIIQPTPTIAEIIDGSLTLLLEKTETIKVLKERGKYVKIGNRDWKIVGWDDLTYDNIVCFNLVETLSFEEDTDIPYPEIDYEKAIISSNLDNISTIQLNSSIILNISTIFKNENIEEEYQIDVVNCNYTDNSIIFDTVGLVEIKITGLKTNVIKTYSLEIKDETISNLVLKVEGRALIKQSVPYSYIIKLIDNGIEVDAIDFNENYDISFEKEAPIKIKKINSSEFFLIANELGTYSIKIKAINKQTMFVLEKEITINCEDLLS